MEDKTINSQLQQKQKMLNAAINLHQNGKLDEAENIYISLLSASPNDSNILHLLGLITHQKGDLKKAIGLIEKAIKLDPKSPLYRSNFGKILNQAGYYQIAEENLRIAIKQNPNLIEAYNSLGIALTNLKKYDEAKNVLLQLVEKAPNDIYGLNNLGNIYYAQKDFENAEKSYNKALALAPKNAVTLNNVAKIFEEKSQFDKAAHFYKLASESAPQSPIIYNNLCNTLTNLHDVKPAIEYATKAISLAPNYAEAHWNKALALLLSQDYINGWQEFEWRIQNTTYEAISPDDQKNKKWNGESLANKKLLILDEQGHGDTIQFSRYIPYIKKEGGEIIFHVKKALIPLLKSIGNIDSFIEWTDNTVDSNLFDYYIPLLSLPYLFKTDISSIPNKTPYLSVVNSNKFQELITPSKINIGIVWAGNTDQKNDKNRSIPLELFSSLFELDNKELQFYSLQKGPPEKELIDFKHNDSIVDLSNYIDNYEDTAHAILKLDLVVSVCTSVAHLSSALDKATWVLLCHNSDWRWHLNGSDSPWYPSAKLFRQKSLGNWGSVIEELKTEIYNFAEEKLTCT